MLNHIINQKNLSYKEYERYARQIVIEEIRQEGQNRIKNARVACIGAGGLNSSTLLYLAACGIGKIGIIDNDIVELSNLQRQVLYQEKDISKKKVERVYKVLTSLNSSTKLKTFAKKLTKENIDNTLSDYEIIIDGTDNFKTRYLISQYCYQSHKIHIYGAIEKFTGHISVFNYQNGTQYYNLYNRVSYSKNRKCGDTGIINTLAGIVGLLQATEAIKIITGIGKIPINQLTVFSLLNSSISRIKIRPRKLINQTIVRHHARYELFKTKYISAKMIMNSKKQSYKIIDVRSSLEFNINSLKNTINIPLDKLKNDKSIKYIKNLDKKYTIIVYCKNTARSYIASQILHSHSVDHYIFKNRTQ